MENNKKIFQRLLYIAFPLMLSSLSSMAMMFCNRLILAKYSLDAHNAAVESANLGWAFISAWVSLASIIQIFVAQNHGAKQHHLLGRFIWQMIWLSGFSCLIFLPAAYLAPDLIFGNDASHEMQRSYLFWMVAFGPFHILFTALSSFFAGKEKVQIIIVVDVLGNVLNCFLCYLFVFGFNGMFETWGIKGAAIATNIALGTQILTLGFAFFNAANRTTYGTKDWKFNLPLLWQCMRIGLPTSIFSFLEVVGWAIFYEMMATLGHKHLTIAGIVQNVLILFNFLGEGLSRSVAILCGHAIGENEPNFVYKYVKMGIFLMTCFAVLLGGTLWGTRTMIADWFLSTLSDSQYALFYPSLMFGLLNIVIYKYLEGVRLVIGGALTAATDTFFLLVAGTFSIWLFMVLPVYQLVYLKGDSIEMALSICSFYTLIAAGLYALRFYQGKWQENFSLVAKSA